MFDTRLWFDYHSSNLSNPSTENAFDAVRSLTISDRLQESTLAEVLQKMNSSLILPKDSYLSYITFLPSFQKVYSSC